MAIIRWRLCCAQWNALLCATTFRPQILVLIRSPRSCSMLVLERATSLAVPRREVGIVLKGSSNYFDHDCRLTPVTPRPSLEFLPRELCNCSRLFDVLWFAFLSKKTWCRWASWCWRWPATRSRPCSASTCSRRWTTWPWTTPRTCSSLSCTCGERPCTLTGHSPSVCPSAHS